MSSMTTKRAAIAVLWIYSAWVMGGLAEFAVGVPAVLGLAFGVAGAVFFALDPLGLVWPKPENRADATVRSVSVESVAAVGEVPAR